MLSILGIQQTNWALDWKGVVSCYLAGSCRRLAGHFEDTVFVVNRGLQCTAGLLQTVGKERESGMHKLFIAAGDSINCCIQSGSIQAGCRC